MKYKYDHGGVHYSVDPYEPPPFSFYNDPNEENRINEIRRKEWMEHHGLNPYHVSFSSADKSDYQIAYEAEQERMNEEAWMEKLESGENIFSMTSGGQEYETLEDPWKQDYVEGENEWYKDIGKPDPTENNQTQKGGGTKTSGDPNQPVKMRVLPAGGGGGFGQSSVFQNLGMDSLNRPGTAGTGGGSATGAESNLMEDNRFLDMNPYITENVRAFNYGGKMRKPKYNYGGKIPKYNYGGATHTMPDGTVHPGATHQEYMAMMGGNRAAMPMYGHGGMHEQRANEAIAINQIANLMGGISSPYMADEGMKMRKRYTQGGRF